MIVAMLFGGIQTAIDYLSGTSDPDSKLMFWVELICLVAFGVAWLVAGKQISFFATEAEKKGED